MLLKAWLSRMVPATPQERAAALWSFAYFFVLLAANYVLRPLRDQMGIAGGVRNLPWLFTATFLVLLLAQPLYGALVARWSRARFIPFVYHFFAANLAVFWLLLTFDVAPVEVARAFFVWVSVFNLFAVAVFWSFMADVFTSEQGGRLFGFIGAGGTAGSLLGPILTIGLSAPLGPVNLLIAAAVLLELAVFCVSRLERDAATMSKEMQRAPTEPDPKGAEARPASIEIGGTAYAGLTELLRSPYLAGIALWVSLLSLTATFLYLQQANIVADTVHDRAAQTRLFASIDLAVGLITLAVQVLVTARLIKRFGVAVAAAALPAVFVIGFGWLALAPALAAVVAVQVIQRSMNFAISNPARHILFTVVAREEKYKAKNMIDVVVYRGSDALWGAVFGVAQTIGLHIATIAACTIPIALGWLALSIALGRTQEQRATQGAAVKSKLQAGAAT
jgi:ATP:ADP antiporter, AAA family